MKPELFARKTFNDVCIGVDGATIHYYNSLDKFLRTVKEGPNVRIEFVESDEQVVICGPRKALAKLINLLSDETKKRKNTNKLFGYTQMLLAKKLNEIDV